MKIAILTSLTGLDKATIADPIYQTHKGVDYFAFVEENQTCKVWNQIKLPLFSSITDGYQDRRNAKFPKILGSLLVPGYDYYVWHDHYLETIIHPRILIEEIVKDKQMGLFKHPLYSCVHQEMDAAIYHKKEKNLEIISSYKDYLKSQNYPINNGLFEMTSFVYKNDVNVLNMMLTLFSKVSFF